MFLLCWQRSPLVHNWREIASPTAYSQKQDLKYTVMKKEEYREAISLLKKDYAIRDVGKSSEKGISTIQRVKKECC